MKIFGDLVVQLFSARAKRFDLKFLFAGRTASPNFPVNIFSYYLLLGFSNYAIYDLIIGVSRTMANGISIMATASFVHSPCQFSA